MKKFSVSYTAPVICEAVVEAKTKREAINKVKEVIGEPVEIEDVWEVK